MHIGQRGFTLLEMMVVVAIIGLLASVSLPAYQNYSARAKMSEVILALSNCRNSITETVQSTPFLPFGGQWACESQAGNDVSTYVASIETSDEGAVRVKLHNINSLLNGQYIIMRPWPDVARSGVVQAGDNVAQWDCGPAPSNTIDISSTLPASCRASAAEIGATSGWASAS
ncbi:MAG: prepilin-type N-terminal cleavage/methylation domain-containing protein [Betaproteobacteria bacterium]|nr:MAG: prepilin-type N-terminal cleavage/methylation domain-containing protein [Betaproteobacteria bacterium]